MSTTNCGRMIRPTTQLGKLLISTAGAEVTPEITWKYWSEIQSTSMRMTEAPVMNSGRMIPLTELLGKLLISKAAGATATVTPEMQYWSEIQSTSMRLTEAPVVNCGLLVQVTAQVDQVPAQSQMQPVRFHLLYLLDSLSLKEPVPLVEHQQLFRTIQHTLFGPMNQESRQQPLWTSQ